MRRMIAILGLLALAACGEGEVTEIARYPAPKGEFDAVVGHLKAGESSPFMVVMTKRGDNPAKGARLMLADQTEPPQLKWVDPAHLTIHCGNARIWSFRNFWSNPIGKQETIAVALDCGRGGWTP